MFPTVRGDGLPLGSRVGEALLLGLAKQAGFGIDGSRGLLSLVQPVERRGGGLAVGGHRVLRSCAAAASRTLAPSCSYSRLIVGLGVVEVPAITSTSR